MTTTFSEFLHDSVGKNWVLARRTPRITRQYGDDVVCLSRSKYVALVNKYERTTGFSAHGMQGEPCDRIKAASLDLLAALDALLNCVDGVHDYEWLNRCKTAARAAITKALGAGT